MDIIWEYKEIAPERRGIVLGKLIKDIRTEENLTQQELATKLCVDTKTVSAYENDRITPPVYILKTLAEQLNGSIVINGESSRFIENTNEKIQKLKFLYNVFKMSIRDMIYEDEKSTLSRDVLDMLVEELEHDGYKVNLIHDEFYKERMLNHIDYIKTGELFSVSKWDRTYTVITGGFSFTVFDFQKFQDLLSMFYGTEVSDTVCMLIFGSRGQTCEGEDIYKALDEVDMDMLVMLIPGLEKYAPMIEELLKTYDFHIRLEQGTFDLQTAPIGYFMQLTNGLTYRAVLVSDGTVLYCFKDDTKVFTITKLLSLSPKFFEDDFLYSNQK